MMAEPNGYLGMSICQKLRQNSLYNLCSPFLMLMRIGGAFFLPTSTCTANSIPDSIRPKLSHVAAGRSKTRWIRTETYERLSKGYCLFSLFWVLAYAGRFVVGLAYTLPSQLSNFYGKDLAHVLSKVANGVWFVDVIMVQLIFLRACWKTDLFYRLFAKWEEWRYIALDKQCIAFSERFLPRRNCVMVFALVMLVPQLLSCWLPALYRGNELGVLKAIVFDGFDPDNAVVSAVTFIGHFFASFVYIVPVFLFALIGLAIESEFCRLNRDITTRLTDQNGCIMEHGLIESFRLKHGKLCDLLELADEIFSFFCLITIGVGVFEIFSLVYVIIATAHEGNRGIALTLAQLYWFTVYVLQPAVVLWTGMKVNESAHAPLSKLYRVNQTNLPNQETLQLHCFIGRLTNTRLGFTAWRMFTIDATALLSLLGLYVTYQLLLFQVQMDLASPESSPCLPIECCNVTNPLMLPT